MSSGSQKTKHTYDNHKHSIDQDHNNNRNSSKRINADSVDGSDHDTDSVSDLEIIFNRIQASNTMPVARKVRNKWPPADALLKRSMSLCSMRTYAHKAINGNDRGTHSTSHSCRGSNCSLDQLAPTKSIGQIEEQALHSDIRRFSFRSRNGTNNFVVNPLFDEYGTEF